MPLAEALWRL